MNCPTATGNPKLNESNMQKAVDSAEYGEAEEDAEYKCENCAAFIQTDEMEDCIEEGLGIDDDDVGYCSQLAFVCSEDNVCTKWLSGGPVTGKNGGIIIKIAGMMDDD